jgi:hypothetical protein
VWSPLMWHFTVHWVFIQVRLFNYSYICHNNHKKFLFFYFPFFTPTRSSTITKIWLWTHRRMCHLFGKWIIKPLLVTPSPIAWVHKCVCVLCTDKIPPTSSFFQHTHPRTQSISFATSWKRKFRVRAILSF